MVSPFIPSSTHPDFNKKDFYEFWLWQCWGHLYIRYYYIAILEINLSWITIYCTVILGLGILKANADSLGIFLRE